ncbi:MAG: TraB/GumN family protein [Gammaproteobacteria bacterium]|nr:TraB/GumN family protein [Gammaproteobacteria bacterium]
MKNIKTLLVLTLLLSSVWQNSYAESGDKSGILHPKGLLWKIEKQGIGNSYLYGTMHVADPRVTNLSTEVEQAFKQADHFAMEVLMNFQAMGIITSASFFNDGRTLKGVMGHIEYKRLTSLINKRIFISEDVINNMKPWAVLMLLMMPVDQQSQGSSALDMVLYRRASQRNMKLSGLETAHEQVSVFDSMSIKEQLWMLNRSIEEIETTDAQMPEMLDAYVSRDLARLVQIQESFMYDDSEIDDQFMYQLLDVRNVRMVKRMTPILETGQAFIAIGALHLPGESGVLHLLEQQGYKVTSVY